MPLFGYRRKKVVFTGNHQLSHKRRGRRRLVLERRRDSTRGLVVARQTVDTRLNENETELRVHVLAVALKVLAHRDGTLLPWLAEKQFFLSTYDKVVKILRNFRCETLSLQDTNNLVTRNEADLCNAAAVTQVCADLRRRHTLTGQLDNLLDNLLRRRLQPRRRAAAVRQRRLGDTLTLRMHTTHDVWKSVSEIVLFFSNTAHPRTPASAQYCRALSQHHNLLDR